ncbi:LacI family DNA-binding transcriptional regulator [Microbacterium sp. NPDC089318]
MIRTRATTAADVAEAAGVSRATVSHILNGRDANFPEATKSRVREAARALDYRPSPAGRSLVRGHSDIVVLLLPGATVGANIQPALERMTADTADLGANVVLRVADGNIEQTIEGLLRMRPLGVVDLGALTASARARLRAQGVAVAPDREVAATGSDHVTRWVAEAQLDALQPRPGDLVHFAVPSDVSDGFFSAARHRALSEQAQSRGVCEVRPFSISLSAPDPADIRGLELSSGRLLVAGYNDLAALATLSAASRLDVALAVPDQLAVVGVDATVEAGLWVPRLTTVSVDIAAIVHASMQEVRRALGLAGAEPAPVTADAVRIVPGSSTRSADDRTDLG